MDFKKNRIISLFFNNPNMEDVLSELKILFKKELIPIRPNKSNEHNIEKYRRRQKSKVSQNQKDVI